MSSPKARRVVVYVVMATVGEYSDARAWPVGSNWRYGYGSETAEYGVVRCWRAG